MNQMVLKVTGKIKIKYRDMLILKDKQKRKGTDKSQNSIESNKSIKNSGVKKNEKDQNES